MGQLRPVLAETGTELGNSAIKSRFIKTEFSLLQTILGKPSPVFKFLFSKCFSFFSHVQIKNKDVLIISKEFYICIFCVRTFISFFCVICIRNNAETDENAETGVNAETESLFIVEMKNVRTYAQLKEIL